MSKGPTKNRRSAGRSLHQYNLPDEIIDAVKLLPKIARSPALNGGFDRLVVQVQKIDEVLNERTSKLESIDNNQQVISEKLDKIHDAIYEPDEGLYARIRDVEVTRNKVELIDDLEKEVLILKEKEKIEIALNKEDEKLEQQRNVLIKEHDQNLRELLDFKRKIVTFSKWFGGLLATSLLGVGGKLLYDFISKHITYQ